MEQISDITREHFLKAFWIS